MDRGRVVPAVALVFAVLALGTIAGGLQGESQAEGERSPGLGIGEGEGSGLGSGSGIGVNTSGGGQPGFPPWFGKAIVLAVVWGSILLAGGYVLAVLVSPDREAIRTIVLRWLRRIVVVSAALTAILAFIVFLQGIFDGGGGGLGGANPEAGTNLGATEAPIPTTDVLGAVLVVVGAALVLLLLASLVPSREGGGTATPTSKNRRQTSEEPPESTLVPDGTVEDVDASNEVYRAWLELRGHVDAGDRTASPADIERRAREAGLDEGAVKELTDLFVAARYGPDEVTRASERRAQDLARRLEDGTEGANV